jgi:NTP pyrophosphatase (non-canonical NTP hydrolase)
MNITEYQNWVVKMWSSRRPVGKNGLRKYTLKDNYIMTAGLAGEMGEVMEHLKKDVRDERPADKRELTKELGDVLYYLMAVADKNGIEAQDIIDTNVKKLTRRYSKKKYSRKSR